MRRPSGRQTSGALPVITTQPASQSVNAGASASLTVAATGATGYQWQFNGTAISGATNSTLTLPAVTTSQQGSYTVVVSNGNGSVTSNAAVLTVNTAPAISTQPQSQSVNAGASATFTVVATGSPAPAYLWYLNSAALANGTQANGSVVSGAASATLTVANTQSGNAGSYAVVVSNTAGSITSAAATLTVNTAPVITTQPQSQTVNAGASVTFTTAATGSPAYQWQFNGAAVSGATNASYTIAGVQASNAGGYTVVASNTAGSVTSSAATLTVDTVPAIITQPQSQTANAGSNVTIGVVAVGTPAPAFQWYFNGQPIAGATSTFYAIIGAQASNAGSYTVFVSNAAGSVTSGAAALAVNTGSGSPPTITAQPQSQTVYAGASATFTVVATGSPAPAYQWLFNGTNISGATNASYTIASVLASNAGSYAVTVSNTAGSVPSTAATLTVNTVPVIATQPASQSANAGASATLSVASANATGYQWQLNGTSIPGATNSTLPLSNVGTTQRGSYTVVVSNSYGSVTSSAATVTVSVNSYLFNISTYGYVGAGAGQDLDAGFFIYGSGTKNILVMGAGPNLANASNGGSAAFAGLALAAPELTFDGVYPAPTAVLGANAAWGGGLALTNAMKAVYAPVFLSNSNDTAITGPVAVSGSNGYTADVTINSGGPGLALVEVDDVDSFKALPAIAPASYLANISTRGYVGASGGSGNGTGIGQYEFLDAGFTIFGSTAQTLLIRAVGPSLSGAPAPTLAKPKLSLYDAAGNVIATNSGWGTAPVAGNSTVAAGILPATTAIMNSVYASTITQGSNDCAMVVTLPSGTSGQGAYTAEVTSADNTSTGVALVEVYNVP